MNMNVLDYVNMSCKQLPLAIGRVLIAKPLSCDIYFRRSVILLIDYDETTGAVGLNLSCQNTLSPKEIDKNREYASRMVSGGPVCPQITQHLHVFKDIPNSITILPGLYLNGDLNILTDNLTEEELKVYFTYDKINFFEGYAGWSPGQLENEVNNGEWIVTQLTPKQIMRPSKHLWAECLLRMGGKFSQWANFPDTPYDN